MKNTVTVLHTALYIRVSLLQHYFLVWFLRLQSMIALIYDALLQFRLQYRNTTLYTHQYNVLIILYVWTILLNHPYLTRLLLYKIPIHTACMNVRRFYRWIMATSVHYIYYFAHIMSHSCMVTSYILLHDWVSHVRMVTSHMHDEPLLQATQYSCKVTSYPCILTSCSYRMTSHSPACWLAIMCMTLYDEPLMHGMVTNERFMMQAARWPTYYTADAARC